MALSVALATQSLVVGSVSGKAVYGYVQGSSAQVLIAGLLASAAAASLIGIAPPAPGRREWVLLGAWLLVALGLQTFIRSLTLFSMESIFVSDGANPFYSVAAPHDPDWILDNFSRLRREAPLHDQGTVPGRILLVQALQLVSARTDVLPWLIVVVSNLGGVLMYTFVRDLSADRTMALDAPLALRAVWCGELTPRRAVLQSALAALALMATSELMRLVFGFEIVRTFRRSRLCLTS